MFNKMGDGEKMGGSISAFSFFRRSNAYWSERYYALGRSGSCFCDADI